MAFDVHVVDGYNPGYATTALPKRFFRNRLPQKSEAQRCSEGFNMPELTETAIRNAKPKPSPYRLKDERGLYLEVKLTGSKLWRLRYTFGGKENMIDLGCQWRASILPNRRRECPR